MKDCTLYKTMDIIGKRWTLCILLELHKGNGKKHFNELKYMLHSITPKTLSTRLKELQDHGLIKRDVESDSTPVRCNYSLTESGEEFIEIISHIKKWGLKWKFENEICSESDCQKCGIRQISDPQCSTQ
ncbi:winged helix-turn-helix transcriptional regulator [Methanosalsum natronophilum]|uniref:Transcriptional regulator n=1 Tax=Methanosalsum natronophilum TaxID=768733 RepID=A0A424YLN8_9EURY|nr:helix-turn-helix domain-containing protein [Methanosalsum natronophilum]MCS3923664.1 DNA-binding HxlR family transcriptional regulator [Methanosalsum natronophilum]RQD79865.1 MAG: transcriptional regulator [Methanosalsum natronophilum]